jgi:hypothetical protein
MPIGDVDRFRVEEVETRLQLRQDLRRAQKLYPRRRQDDAQGQSIEQSTDLDHRSDVTRR